MKMLLESDETVQSIARKLNKTSAWVERQFLNAGKMKLSTVSDLASACDRYVDIQMHDPSDGRVFGPEGERPQHKLRCATENAAFPFFLLHEAADLLEKGDG